MKGAIYFSTKYGSTKEYAEWIAEASGLPVYNVLNKHPDPSDFDFLVIGSPIIYYKLSIHKWIKENIHKIEDKHVIFFSVSGAPSSEKLSRWIKESLPESLVDSMDHVALRGRQIPRELTMYDRIMLQIAGRFNKDPQAAKEELKGFDYMDENSIGPILKLIEQFQESKVYI